MKTVLISIHWNYLKRILDGSKTVELRKAWNSEIDRVYVYCPIGRGAPKDKAGKVVAVFDAKSVLRASPAEIWNQHTQGAGILHADFETYYKGKETGCAIRICNVEDVDIEIGDLILRNKKPAKPPQGYSFLMLCESCETGVALRYVPEPELMLCGDCEPPNIFLQSFENPEKVKAEILANMNEHGAPLQTETVWESGWYKLEVYMVVDGWKYRVHHPHGLFHSGPCASRDEAIKEGVADIKPKFENVNRFFASEKDVKKAKESLLDFITPNLFSNAEHRSDNMNYAAMMLQKHILNQ